MTNLSMTSKQLYNLDYLNSMANGNKDFIPEMIGIFVDEVPGKLLEFEKGIENEDFAAIKHAAHNMKSTIPFFGLEKYIEAEIIDIEELATDKMNIAKIKHLFVKVKAVCEMVVEELKENYTR